MRTLVGVDAGASSTRVAVANAETLEIIARHAGPAGAVVPTRVDEAAIAIADTVRAVLPTARIVNQGGEGADLHHAPMDISAAREVLGWRPQWPLEDGIRAYAEWLRDHEF